MNKNFKYANCIHDISGTVKTTEKDKEIRYLSNGSIASKKIDEADIAAKKIIKNSEITYYVKSNKNYELFNPYDPDYHNQSVIFSKGLNKNPYESIKVSEKCFTYYLAFLEEKDKTHYRMAQRELSQQEFKDKEYTVKTTDSEDFPQYDMYLNVKEESKKDDKPKNTDTGKRNKTKKK